MQIKIVRFAMRWLKHLIYGSSQTCGKGHSSNIKEQLSEKDEENI